MQITSPAPGGFACTRLECLSGAQAPQCWAAIVVFCTAAGGFAFVCVYMCVLACMHQGSQY